MALPWFRLYTDILADPKVQILSFEDQRHFIMLLALKANGTLDSEGVTEETLNRLVEKGLGIDHATAMQLQSRCMCNGLLLQGWRIRNWEKRQNSYDNSTARSRKHREKKKAEMEMQRDATVAATLRDGVDKIRQDKIREETPQPPEVADAPGAPPNLDHGAWKIWVEYRKRRKPAIRPESAPVAMKQMAALGSEQLAAVEHSIANGYQGLIAPDKKSGTIRGSKEREGWT